MEPENVKNLTVTAGKVIKVPDVPADENLRLCWKQEVKNHVIQTFERCTKPKHHDGPHSWEKG